MIRSREMAATVVGAVLGGVAGYLFLTDRGRSIRRQIEPALAELSSEITSFRGTVATATEVASEGWKLVNVALGEAESATTFPGRQTAPF